MKKERDYSKGKIYKIWSFNSPDIYIGSTIQALSERLRGHIRGFNRYKKTGKGFCASFIILENEHYDIELIEYYPCKTKAELCRREGELQRKKDCVNKLIAGRTKKEYYEDNKEKFKEYREENKEKIKEKKKEYRKNNKPKIKEWREANKEKISKKNKEWREENKEKIKECEKERLKIRIICECGTDIMKATKSRHIKTLTHIRLMEEKKTI